MPAQTQQNAQSNIAVTATSTIAIWAYSGMVFRFTFVPEPSPVALAALGFLAVVCRVRR